MTTSNGHAETRADMRTPHGMSAASRRFVISSVVCVLCSSLVGSPVDAFSFPVTSLIGTPRQLSLLPSLRPFSRNLSTHRCLPTVVAERTEQAESTEFTTEKSDVESEPCQIQYQTNSLVARNSGTYLNWIHHRHQEEDMEAQGSRVRRVDDFGDELGETSDDKPTWKVKKTPQPNMFKRFWKSVTSVRKTRRRSLDDAWADSLK
mmetsp:Transcript_7285/g.14461  ORF Transcript_7285/g.14461 Transcript_7285/m.14461 type:complete len:205 (+) Transcript_7285:117-731(+)